MGRFGLDEHEYAIHEAWDNQRDPHWWEEDEEELTEEEEFLKEIGEDDEE